MKLTAKGIRSLQLPEGKTDHLFWDDDIPGLGLRLRAGGSRNWVFQYALGDKQRRLSLGAATEESFKTVRQKDDNGNEVIKLGVRDRTTPRKGEAGPGSGDKTEARKRASDIFEAIAKKFLFAKKESLRAGSYVEVERHILKHAKPLNGLQVVKITRRDIANLISALRVKKGHQKGGPIAANRVRSTLSDLFSWAMSEGIDGLETNPVINTNKSEERSRERVLKDHELRAIWKHAGDDHYGSIIKLLMLTGQRAAEIASLHWSEIIETTVPEKRVTDAIRLPQFNTKAIDLGRAH